MHSWSPAFFNQITGILFANHQKVFRILKCQSRITSCLQLRCEPVELILLIAEKPTLKFIIWSLFRRSYQTRRFSASNLKIVAIFTKEKNWSRCSLCTEWKASVRRTNCFKYAITKPTTLATGYLWQCTCFLTTAGKCQALSNCTLSRLHKRDSG